MGSPMPLLLLANMVAAASAAASATDQSNVRQPWAFISRLTKYEGPQLTSGRDSAQGPVLAAVGRPCPAPPLPAAPPPLHQVLKCKYCVCVRWVGRQGKAGRRGGEGEGGRVGERGEGQ